MREEFGAEIAKLRSEIEEARARLAADVTPIRGRHVA